MPDLRSIVTQLKPKNGTPSEGGGRYKSIFDDARVALWDEDFSKIWGLLEELRKRGVTDIRSYFEDRPAELAAAVNLVTVCDVNQYAVELFEAENKGQLLVQLDTLPP